MSMQVSSRKLHEIVKTCRKTQTTHYRKIPWTTSPVNQWKWWEKIYFRPAFGSDWISKSIVIAGKALILKKRTHSNLSLDRKFVNSFHSFDEKATLKALIKNAECWKWSLWQNLHIARALSRWSSARRVVLSTSTELVTEMVENNVSIVAMEE